jgi:hypothetical protein
VYRIPHVGFEFLPEDAAGRATLEITEKITEEITEEFTEEFRDETQKRRRGDRR